VGLRARGLEPLVMAPPRSPLLQECKRAGVATSARTMRGALDVLAARGLRRMISGWRPTLVHAHDPRSHALAIAALLGKRSQVPLVVTRRLGIPPRGGFKHGTRVARFIAITEAVRATLRAGGIADERITLVHPGVERPALARVRDWRAECGWTPDTVVLGVVGPRTELKHRDELSRLVAAMSPETRSRAGLVLLGGPATGRGEVAGVPAYGAGFVHEVPAALAGLDLLLHPGGAEGLGTALVEGMALQVPAVAFAAGGVGEIIAPGVSGLLIPPGDEAAFARAVDHLVADPDRRRALGAAGPTRASEFGADRMIDRTLAVYRDVTGSAGLPPLGG